MTAMTMKERIRQALHESMNEQDFGGYWESRIDAAELAEAVLDAMREPDERLTERTGGVSGWGSLPISFDHWMPEHIEWWQAMIDAAKTEGQSE